VTEVLGHESLLVLQYYNARDTPCHELDDCGKHMWLKYRLMIMNSMAKIHNAIHQNTVALQSFSTDEHKETASTQYFIFVP
jgi:hypothetical protein